MINWDDATCIKFRIALLDFYPNKSDWEILVRDALNENLAALSLGDTLRKIAFDVVAWARLRNRLDEVFEVFRQENPNNPVVMQLQQRSLVARSSHLSEADWEMLFDQFLIEDLADLQRAFYRGFQQALKVAFQQARPDCPPLTDLAQVQKLLVAYDNPELAVRFVEVAIAELRRSDEGNERDLTGLEQWRDRIVQQFKIQPLAPQPTQNTVRQGHLLLVFEESGSDVTVYPELRVTGEEKPINFGVSHIKCSFREVPNYLSEWISLAEKALDGLYDAEEILLELFLPCKLLEKDLATVWEVKNQRGRAIPLGMHQMFVVRSLDRLTCKHKDKIKKKLERKWQLLEKCMSEGNACDKFHLQAEYLETPGALLVVLEDGNVAGLKLVAQLPSDRHEREDLLYEIIDSAVPIALWSPSLDAVSLAEIQTQMNSLVRESNLTSFADLAHRWRRKFAQPATEAVKHIRLLCDCPDRVPNLPDPKREEDLLVA